MKKFSIPKMSMDDVIALSDSIKASRTTIMKTVLLICVLLLAGCSDESTGVNGNGEKIYGSFQYIYWNGHRYVNYCGLYNSGITHDPDCPNCFSYNLYLAYCMENLILQEIEK